MSHKFTRLEHPLPAVLLHWAHLLSFFVLIATVVFSLQQVFTPIDILTEGGPENGTTNFFYMVYQLAFRTFDIGRGAAGTVLLFGLLLVITLIKLRALDKRVHYQQ
jgi:multiple sugar transport system permease protein/sn-glycerol 3-phosphate transport system permease protein